MEELKGFFDTVINLLLAISPGLVAGGLVAFINRRLSPVEKEHMVSETVENLISSADQNVKTSNDLMKSLRSDRVNDQKRIIQLEKIVKREIQLRNKEIRVREKCQEKLIENSRVLQDTRKMLFKVAKKAGVDLSKKWKVQK